MPLWVPIAVAALGFIGVLTTQVIGAWREDRRWRREKEHRDLDHWRKAKQEAYATLIGSVERWDMVMFPVWMARKTERVPTDEQTEKLLAAQDATEQSFGLVNLVSPEAIRQWIPRTVLVRSRLTTRLLYRSETDVAELEEFWEQGQENYKTLRALMRGDLDIDPKVKDPRQAEDVTQ
ncbi:hypothetical protein D5S17_02960 [Pseudonocardiaceae bacterium YIM PH 21723]|nr:hypothetical protein D5S17_02960 [Pseudonocardiaceae bacterium YIM PH 21723]